MNTRLSTRRKQCSICYENIEDKGQIDSCSHQFCFECIKIWAEKQNTCPVCRVKFSEIRRKESRINYCESSRGRRDEVIRVEEKTDLKIFIPVNEIMPLMIELFERLGSRVPFTLI